MELLPSTAEIEAYYQGVRDAVRALAIWHDGEQYVGVQRRPLRAVLAEIDAYQSRAVAAGRIFDWPY